MSGRKNKAELVLETLRNAPTWKLVGVAGLATVLIATLIAPSLANHIHMHGGPFIGVVLSVVVDPKYPKTVYCAAFGGGVFRSGDHGASWTVINQGLPNRRVLTLLVSDRDPNKLYVGTDQGIFYSSDNGNSWKSLAPVLRERNIRSLAIDPEDPDGLYAATDRGVFRGQGKKWASFSHGLASQDVRIIVTSPRGEVFAGTFGGVFKKDKGRRSWVAINRGLLDKSVRALAIDPFNAGTLFAGTASGGVFKTTDGGRYWEASNRGILNRMVLSLAMTAIRPPTLYAGTVGGVFKTQNGGNQWRPAGLELPFTVTALAFSAAEPNRVYAGSGGRLFISSDAGKIWQEVAHQVNYFGPDHLSTKHRRDRGDLSLERR